MCKIIFIYGYLFLYEIYAVNNNNNIPKIKKKNNHNNDDALKYMVQHKNKIYLSKFTIRCEILTEDEGVVIKFFILCHDENFSIFIDISQVEVIICIVLNIC